MISCVLLAAGMSSRFGSPKALAMLEDVPVIERLLRSLALSPVSEVVVVLGAHNEMIRPLLLKHTRLKIVYNKDYILGQTSSFKAGWAAVGPSSRGVMLLPVDLPLVQPSTLDLLCREFTDGRSPVLIPSFQGRRGHPPVFSCDLRDDVLRLPDSSGMNTLIRKYEREASVVETGDEGVVLSFNTAEEFARVRAADRRP